MSGVGFHDSLMFGFYRNALVSLLADEVVINLADMLAATYLCSCLKLSM